MNFHNNREYEGDRATTYDERRAGRLEWSREFTLVNRIFGTWLKGNSTILDAPTGTGRFLPVLRHLGYHVTGMDISRDMLQVAEDRAKSSAANLVHGDCEFLPFRDNSFDYVLSLRFMGHLPPKTRIKVLQEFKRVSKKGLVVGFPVLNPLTFLLFRLGNIRHTLRTGEKRPWWPASPRSLAGELAQAGLRISGKWWLLRPLWQIALLYLTHSEPRHQDDKIPELVDATEQIHASMPAMGNES